MRGAKPPFGHANLPQDLSASLRQPEIAKLDLRYADGDYSRFQLSIPLSLTSNSDFIYSAICVPEPPNSAGKSLNFGSP